MPQKVDKIDFGAHTGLHMVANCVLLGHFAHYWHVNVHFKSPFKVNASLTGPSLTQYCYRWTTNANRHILVMSLAQKGQKSVHGIMPVAHFAPCKHTESACMCPFKTSATFSGLRLTQFCQRLSQKCQHAYSCAVSCTNRSDFSVQYHASSQICPL